MKHGAYHQVCDIPLVSGLARIGKTAHKKALSRGKKRNLGKMHNCSVSGLMKTAGTERIPPRVFSHHCTISDGTRPGQREAIEEVLADKNFHLCVRSMLRSRRRFSLEALESSGMPARIARRGFNGVQQFYEACYYILEKDDAYRRGKAYIWVYCENITYNGHDVAKIRSWLEHIAAAWDANSPRASNLQWDPIF